MSKSKKPMMVLATWPDSRGAQYFGHQDGGYGVAGCDSFWLSFRSVSETDSCHYLDASARAVSDIGLYVWFDERGSLSTYLALHDRRSLQLHEVDIRFKVLQKLSKKMPSLSGRNAASFRQALMDIMGGIGVTKAVEFRHTQPIKDSGTIPVYDAVEVIAKEFDRRFAVIKKLD